MKRILLLIPIFFLFIACRKKEVAQPVSGTGYWSLGLDTTYHSRSGSGDLVVKKTIFNIIKVVRQSIHGNFVLTGLDSIPLDSLQVYFATEPLYNKKYQPVSFNFSYTFYPYSNFPHLSANEIGIISRINIPTYNYNFSEFYSTPKEDNYHNIMADSVTVIVNNGKITVNIPRMLTNGFIANQDSAMLQGVMMEK